MSFKIYSYWIAFCSSGLLAPLRNRTNGRVPLVKPALRAIVLPGEKFDFDRVQDYPFVGKGGFV